jgi:hypothetical protein
MIRAPRRWLSLFGASALCWWGFEWLNRFVENWHYLNVQHASALEYVLHGSLCFSTVLPAVTAVAEWLGSSVHGTVGAFAGPRWTWIGNRTSAWVLLIGGVVALVGTGSCPAWFYPALWVSPLALMLAVQVLIGRDGVAQEIAAGDWRRATVWMTAALVCGFFWELWNWRSAAKWIYTVPGVDRWHVFEMPLLGYVGYLPFGLECLVVTEAVIGKSVLAPAALRNRGAGNSP